MPKVAIPDWTPEPAHRHPVLGAVLGAYAHPILGDAAGLTQFGVHLERLPPGSRSSCATGTRPRTSSSTCSTASSR